MALLASSDYQKIKQNFFEELKNAANNKPSSIPFIKHPLPEKPLITDGLVQGIVIGGTNYIVATEVIVGGKSKQIIQKQTGILPIMDNADTLKRFLVEHLNLKAQAIGINFGFPLSPAVGPFDELDGILRNGTKEHLFRGVINESIGDIVRAVAQKSFPVAVANDTICLALSGEGTEDGSLIAGTGFNIGLKYNDGNQPTLVNLEAGNFDKFAPSDILQTIDKESEQPGAQRFEKCISGKYLALYFDRKAAAMGLTLKPLTTSQELSALSQETNDSKANHLARELLERSAFYVAAALAGIYLFCGEKQLTIIGEGSLLWKGWKYKEHIDQQLTALGIPNDGVIIKHIPDSSIKGAIGLLTK